MDDLEPGGTFSENMGDMEPVGTFSENIKHAITLTVATSF